MNREKELVFCIASTTTFRTELLPKMSAEYLRAGQRVLVLKMDRYGTHVHARTLVALSLLEHKPVTDINGILYVSGRKLDRLPTRQHDTLLELDRKYGNSFECIDFFNAHPELLSAPELLRFLQALKDEYERIEIELPIVIVDGVQALELEPQQLAEILSQFSAMGYTVVGTYTRQDLNDYQLLPVVTKNADTVLLFDKKGRRVIKGAGEDEQPTDKLYLKVKYDCFRPIDLLQMVAR